MKSKEIKQINDVFAKGGSTRMFGAQSADPSLAGVSSPANGRQAPNNKFGIPSGVGNSKMFPEQSANPSHDGTSSPSNGRHSADNSWGIKGIKGKMAGHSGASPAKAR